MSASPPVEIRPATSADAEAVSRVIARSLRETNARDYPPHVIDAVTVRYSAERLVALMVGRQVLVAVKAGVVVGTASREDTHVETVYVAPEEQGRGIGSALMAVLEELARATGVEVIHVASSITAEGFYRRLGFAPQTSPSDRDDRLIPLSKRLAGGSMDPAAAAQAFASPGGSPYNRPVSLTS